MIAETFFIPFGNGGLNAYKWFCYNIDGSNPLISSYHEKHPERMGFSNGYGHGSRFRDWLFKEYCAEIVQYNGHNTIRFLDEHTMLLYTLKWGI